MEATTEKVKILSAGAITAMLRRMAFEIYERNFSETEIVLAGVGVRGGYLAGRLATHLADISPLRLTMTGFVKQPESENLSWADGINPAELAGKHLVVVDDVLYSGATILQALVLLAPLGLASIQTAFLIDRGHHRYPLTHDYVGMEMATSLKQYISVEVDTSAQRAEAFIF